MVFQLIDTNTVGIGTRVFLPAFGDGTHVLAGVIVASATDITIFGEVSGLDVLIDGSVSTGGAAAVKLGENSVFDGDQRVFVGTTGSIRAQLTAVWIVGHDSQIVNHGQIGGGDAGIVVNGQGLGQTGVTNHGVISADVGISRGMVSDSESIRVHNLGTLEGSVYAFDGSSNAVADQIINRGLIVGDIRLGGGDDRFDGRGGGQVLGQIFGGSGADTFLLGYGEETISGDSGVDTLDASTSMGVTLALDASLAGTGRTAGDSYLSIEAVIGSRLGADRIYGAALAETLTGLGGTDWLEGRAGQDTLLGGAGNDRLVGEAGADRLTGGAGDDRFVFRLVPEAGDVIADFAGLSGNNDAFEVAVAGFGAGLVKGVLAAGMFQSRADNLAQDADDRFIFRTSDATLWFDNNGNASGGLTMLADVQAGAVVTAGDILLV
jgi:Ca2+-binding RTX toxin-like protein